MYNNYILLLLLCSAARDVKSHLELWRRDDWLR